MLQYSPNSEFFSIFSPTQFKGKYPFLTVSEIQGSGASPTVSLAVARVSSPPSEPWSGWSQF